MFNWTRPLVIVIALFVTACSGPQATDWLKKLEESDRQSTMKGMLSELSDYEQQIALMSDKSSKLTHTSVFEILKLDRSPIKETDPDNSEALFGPLETARDYLSDQEDNYLDLIREVRESLPNQKFEKSNSCFYGEDVFLKFDFRSYD